MLNSHQIALSPHSLNQLRQSTSLNLEASNLENLCQQAWAQRKFLCFAESTSIPENQKDLLAFNKEQVFFTQVWRQDSGHHHNPHQASPLAVRLAFVSGLILTNAPNISDNAPGLNLKEAYSGRFQALFAALDAWGNQHQKPVFVSIPGIGCGAFSGPYSGMLGAPLKAALGHAVFQLQLKWVRHIWFDPYSELLDNKGSTYQIGPDTHLHLQPSYSDSNPIASLQFERMTEKLQLQHENYLFAKVVAWDPLSWPGNDWWGASRATDDGVVAAATSLMSSLTQIPGYYNTEYNGWCPQSNPAATWRQSAIEIKSYPEWVQHLLADTQICSF